MRELLGGAAEDLRKPLDPFLMRHVHEGPVAEHIRQAVRAVVRRRDLLRRPKVPPPRRIGQRKQHRKSRCQENGCQISSCLLAEFTSLASAKVNVGAQAGKKGEHGNIDRL